MIEGVELIPLITHNDERGFFREILKSSQLPKFGQWSMSWMRHDLIKAFHIHSQQTDYWYVVNGIIKAVVIDQRNNRNYPPGTVLAWTKDGFGYPYSEYILGDYQKPQVLVIPPGVAHGLKVLQGPAILMYITSHEYNPEDEGRIPYNALGYDWHKEVIK